MISPITEGYDVLLTRWDANGTLPLCFPPQSNGRSQDELKETQQVNVMGYAWCGGWGGATPVPQLVKNLPAVQETPV